MLANKEITTVVGFFDDIRSFSLTSKFGSKVLLIASDHFPMVVRTRLHMINAIIIKKFVLPSIEGKDWNRSFSSFSPLPFFLLRSRIDPAKVAYGYKLGDLGSSPSGYELTWALGLASSSIKWKTNPVS